MAKGSLLTSSGSANGEFTACTNGQILEWDSTETSGFKCVTKPTEWGYEWDSYGSGSGRYCMSSTTETAIPNISISYTTNSSGNPVEAHIPGSVYASWNQVDGEDNYLGGCTIALKRAFLEKPEDARIFEQMKNLMFFNFY